MWKTLCEGSWLLLLGLVDVRHRRVSLWMILAGIPVGLIFEVWKRIEGSEDIPGFVFRLIPGMLMLFLALTKKAGCGDGLVLLILGLMETGRNLMGIFALSLVIMAIPAGILLLLRKVKKETHLPYLPFLFMSWGISKVWL